MKKVAFTVLLLMAILMTSSCTLPANVANDKMGNTNGNMVNYGLAAMSGDWIYYSSMDDGPLYKIKTNGTQKTKLCDDRVRSINIVGDWIYYLNSHDDSVYKIKTDGTERSMIYKVGSFIFFVVGDWIYFRNPSDLFIYRVKIDGTAAQKITNDRAEWFNIQGDWVYYTVWKKTSKTIYSVICKGKTDGTKQETICNDSIGAIIVENGWIYYVANEDIYKIKTDGKKKTKVTNTGNVFAEGFNVSGDWIYYNTYNFTKENPMDTGLWKIKTDGSNVRRISEISVNTINIVGNWIYYSNFYSRPSGDLCKMKTDGTANQLVETKKIY